ncbi:MAG: HD domain-containing protein, partial [Bacteroidia bacterium]|nr:HD domain-containing protein [Bacteroidia bacterium]
MQLPLEGSIFKQLGTLADNMNLEAYIIGGYVRDLVMGRPSKDIDVVVKGSGIEFAKAFSESMPGSKFNYFGNFGTAQVICDEFEIEFVGARKESYERQSRKPVVEEGSLEEDRNRRDLTINAMGISLNKETYGLLNDPFNGLEDIENRMIRTPLEPDKTFSDDPLRMMRAIRFASQLGFDISEETFDGIKRNANRISIISMERISDELNKIILSPVPSIGFNYLNDTGLMEIIFPELFAMHGVETINGKSHKDNFYHTLQVLDNISLFSKNLWLRWSAILHDIAKPATKKFYAEEGWTFHGHEDKGSRMVKPIFSRLRLPLGDNMKYVQKLVLLHLRPIVLSQEIVTDSAVRRLIVDAGEDITDLIILCRSDITSKNERKVEKFLRNLDQVEIKIREVTEKDRLRNWQPPITGEHILQA